MATDMTTLRGVDILADEAPRMGRPNRDLREREMAPQQTRAQEPHPASQERPAAAVADQELALAPLVDHVAYGFARVLVAAMKELETHIGNENRKLGENVGERLDSLQASVNELAGAALDQRSASRAIMDKFESLEAATVSLKDADNRRHEEISALRTEVAAAAEGAAVRIDSAVTALEQADDHQKIEIASVRVLMDAQTAALRDAEAREASDVAALRDEAKAFSASTTERIEVLHSEIAVQQEDIAALKTGLSSFGSRVDALLERLDKQAEAVHSMYLTYSQRESELEHLIEGLTRLRSVPPMAAASRL
jgi:chromosome segregation ATPase